MARASAATWRRAAPLLFSRVCGEGRKGAPSMGAGDHVLPPVCLCCAARRMVGKTQWQPWTGHVRLVCAVILVAHTAGLKTGGCY